MADEFESYLDPELVTVKIIFTPQITGEHGRDRSMGYYGSLAAASLNAEGEVIGSGQNCQVYAESEKQCKLLLNRALLGAIKRTLEILGVKNHEVRPLSAHGHCHGVKDLHTVFDAQVPRY